MCYLILLDNTSIYENINSKNLSKKVISISNLVKPNLPDYWFYPWVKDLHDSLSYSLREKFKINQNSYEEAADYIEYLIEKNRFTWPNMFGYEEDAKYFITRFFSDISNLFIVCVALDDKHYSKFIEYEIGNFPSTLKDTFINSKAIENDNEIIGIDICGWSNNLFYSFMLNELQIEFLDMGFTLNEYSLISNIDSANKIIELIDNETIEAEEVNWYPWIVSIV